MWIKYKVGEGDSDFIAAPVCSVSVRRLKTKRKNQQKVEALFIYAMLTHFGLH